MQVSLCGDVVSARTVLMNSWKSPNPPPRRERWAAVAVSTSRVTARFDASASSSIARYLRLDQRATRPQPARISGSG